MPPSKNLNTYSDIAAILQAVRNSGADTASYTCETPGQAVNFRSRVYQYRSLLRKQAKEAVNRPGFEPTTDWDDLVLDLEKGSCTVTMRFGRSIGQLVIEGQQVPVIPTDIPRPTAEAEHILETADVVNITPVDEDELVRAAEELMRRRGA